MEKPEYHDGETYYATSEYFERFSNKPFWYDMDGVEILKKI